ncbi:carbohydrate kinase [Natronococcus sp. A-GB7]|uniref:carbohydrate kinase family protein n=1 Tax=Natronococcus sp. A-GB7 TaxID=3037649 RepID=UPI00241D35A4|nr:carbohydrate kinase [Natronococcus sp. A-GB7]MDG5818804.1 carbohydrate kinase [Natronococcus sp. A-GB7]
MTRDILVAGETLIDFLPEHPGPISSVERFDRRPGGAPANVAVALERLERTPLFWTRVGEDPFGRYLVETLADHGLPDRFVERDPAAQTTLAFVTHDETGDREFSFYRDDTADTRMEPGRIDDAVLEELEWVHAGGVALSAGSSREATLDLLERAGSLDCTVSFDPNARPELWPDDDEFREVVREALAHVDVLKAAEEELEALGFAGAGVDEMARDALSLEAGPSTVLATRGGEGALAVADEDAPWAGTASHPGYDADVVDTTGAGDAFVAGAIASLSDGDDLEEMLAFANAVGATATTAAGAMTALPDREAVRAIRDAE